MFQVNLAILSIGHFVSEGARPGLFVGASSKGSGSILELMEAHKVVTTTASQWRRVADASKLLADGGLLRTSCIFIESLPGNIAC